MSRDKPKLKDPSVARLQEIVIDLDLAKKKQEEERIFSEALLQGLSTLSKASTINQIFLGMLEQLKEVLSYDSALVLTKGRGDWFNCRASTKPEFGNLRLLNGKKIQRILRGKPLIMGDISNVYEWQEVDSCIRDQIVSSIYMPVLGQNQRAILVFVSEKKSFFEMKHKELLSRMTPLVTQAICKLEDINEINRQKNEMRVILKNIRQGIFTFSDRLIVDEEFSEYLKVIFQTNNIAGQPAVNFLFKEAENIGTDKKKQVSDALNASIGFNHLGFKTNQSLLPSQLTNNNCNGKQILELDWQPVTNEAFIVEKILVSIRDVTEIKRLKREALENRKANEIINQIIEVGPKKFDKIFANLMSITAESRKLLQNTEEIEAETVKGLFRYMHTAKGNCRTFGLTHLLEPIHIAEESYEDILNNGFQAELDDLLSDLKNVENAMARYIEVRKNKLTDFGEANRNNENLQDYITMFTEKSQVSSLEGKAKAFDILLFTHNYSSFVEAIDSTLKGITKSSELLNKPSPKFIINDNNLWVKTAKSQMLSDVINHCMRNSIHHGIESPKERISAKKNPRGKIILDLYKADNGIYLDIADDGRGLNLKAISEQAQLKRHNQTDESLADLIFSAGLSTAKHLTQVAGRGIGLNAVRQTLRNLGGDAEVAFTSGRRADDSRPFKMRILLPEDLIDDPPAEILLWQKQKDNAS